MFHRLSKHLELFNSGLFGIWISRWNTVSRVWYVTWTSRQKRHIMLPLCYRLSMQNPQRAISALSLLITCMYTGRKLSDFFFWHSSLLEDLMVFYVWQAKLATDRVESTLSLTLWSFQQKIYSSLPWNVSRFFLTGWFNRFAHGLVWNRVYDAACPFSLLLSGPLSERP